MITKMTTINNNLSENNVRSELKKAETEEKRACDNKAKTNGNMFVVQNEMKTTKCYSKQHKTLHNQQ